MGKNAKEDEYSASAIDDYNGLSLKKTNTARCQPSIASSSLNRTR